LLQDRPKKDLDVDKQVVSHLFHGLDKATGHKPETEGMDVEYEMPQGDIPNHHTQDHGMAAVDAAM